MRAFDNCLVCGASTENTHSARRGSDALVCGGDCYKQASRNFKRNMSGYKVARLVDLLAQMGGPVTAAQLLARYRDTYGKSAMMGFNNTNAVTQQLMPIVNPETIRVDKTKNPFTFEYLGGTTIGEWLKPSMRAKYESVSFRSETFYQTAEYAPIERIIRRLKDSGVWELGEEYDSIKTLQYIWWATVRIEDGTLVRADFDSISPDQDRWNINLVLLIDNPNYPKRGRLAVSYTDVDNAEWEGSYNEAMEKLGKEIIIIFKNNGMFQSDDDLQYGGMGEYYEVLWGDLVNHSCADNAKFDIYEEDEGQGLITMECMECGRTSTFRQETPYEGPRKSRTDKQMFGAEEEEDEEELKQYSVTVPVLHYYSFGPVEAYDEDEAVDEVRNNWGHWRRTIENNGDWGGPLWRYSRLSSHDPEAYEILDSETFGSESQQEIDVSVGDRVRSYDFILPDGTLIRDDCYKEGRVTKIAPVDWCGSECDHYYILVDKIVRNGEELSERMPGVDMVYPPVSESYLEVINETFAAEHETFEVETDEYKGPFSVEIRRPNGSIVSWKKYDDYRQLIDALEEIVSNRYTPYAIDVFATQVSYISGFTAMGPVNDYRKFHLATWKYGNWESGPWAEYLPTGLE